MAKVRGKAHFSSNPSLNRFKTKTKPAAMRILQEPGRGAAIWKQRSGLLQSSGGVWSCTYITRVRLFRDLRESELNFSKLADQVSVSIRALPKKAIGECRLCTTQGELLFWDADLSGRICQECEPFLEGAETALVAAKCGHPTDFLVFRNP